MKRTGVAWKSPIARPAYPPRAGRLAYVRYISTATIHVVFGLRLLVIPRGLSVTLSRISDTPTVLRVYLFASCIPSHPKTPI